MEAAAVAASAAATAAKEAALAASVAAAAAAATAKEATDVAKDAAAAASAAALNAKEAASRASDAALNAKEAADVAAIAGEAAAAAAAAAMQASKKRKFHLIDADQDPPGIGDTDVDEGIADVDDNWIGDLDDEGSVDRISRLPDAVLCSIVSLLPTKEAARTQAISHRWRPLWRSAPLNLVADFDYNAKGTIDTISKILSQHPGPVRRFSFRLFISFSLFISDCSDKVKGWLSSQVLDNLQELELTYCHFFEDREKLFPLPSSAYRFAPTLRVAKFHGCQFPDLIVALSFKFPCLKQLTMETVTISDDALQSFLSGCPALESLELKRNFGIGRLCISSQTLKSLGFCADSRNEGVLLQELVVEDAPCLERLLPLDPKYGPATIQIISAPKLKILGVLSEDISELHLGTTVFQKLIAVGLTTEMHTIRVLVLDSAGPNLDTVVNFLKCFPCLERLYVSLQFQSLSCPSVIVNNVRKYDPLDPIECLELHLKKVVLKNYESTKSSSIDFAKFFVLNAKVLKEMKIILPYHRQHKWFAKRYEMLRIKDRASQDAQIELKCGTKNDFSFTHNQHTHDLSMADPFGIPSSGCSKCS